MGGVKIWEHFWQKQKYGELMKRRALGQAPEMEQMKLLKKLIRQVSEPNMKVLDVGCGAGHFYPPLKKIIKNMVYHGVDISDCYLDMAKEVFSREKNATFSRGDVEKLDVDNNSYDIVICYQVLPYIPDYHKAVRELMRVTKKHVFIRPVLSDYTHVVKIFYEGFKEGAPYHYYNIYSEDEFLKYLKRCGARKIRVYEDQSRVLKKKRGFPLGTHSYGKLEIYGNVILTWKVVYAIK